MAATVIAALFALVGIALVFKFLLSAKVEEKNVGWFHRRVLRAVPVQPLKIVVVVWQILTQVCGACIELFGSSAAPNMKVVCQQNDGFGVLGAHVPT